MNLLRKFIHNEENDEDGEDYSELYVGENNLPETESAQDNYADAGQDHAENDYSGVGLGGDKVSLKLMQPQSHTEATRIADQLKEGSIVLLDIGNLTKEQAHRLVDFLAGVVYILGGEMIRSNKNTIIVSPAGVDVSGFVPEESQESGCETIAEDNR